tara:strand:- start:7887 stop:8189 length:303 start_codon:yes stop_codon:yes gene_type:complete
MTQNNTTGMNTLSLKTMSETGRKTKGRSKRKCNVPPKDTGHEVILRNLIGKSIAIERHSGEVLVSDLIAFDKFSVIISDGAYERVIFKAAIASFAATNLD